ncbi:AMP-dependent synthetase [Nocardiopsis gilva YIM 90087]|uniref:AMP-dependent synthetase n=1 Tax=Nocardiopsis gilva YIM 90087 TaxID=1235441 RepID=A0A223S4N9_9ACTN|nr:AMP-binding protein [Nocardiopsis gilva]ASU82999.1 AMP-dependent synthetase [Nocardiopsis gilva YIM 90087]
MPDPATAPDAPPAAQPTTVHRLTLGDILREHRRSRPRTTAAVDGRVRLTYPQLDDRVDRLAAALPSAGAAAGSRVLYIGRTSVRFQEILLAAARIGAIAVPANWRQSTDELAFVLHDLSPAVVLWQPEPAADELASARAAANAPERWIRCDGASNAHPDADAYTAFLHSGRGAAPEPPVTGADPVIGLYTAAFDGRPNCALLSHDALLANSAALLRMRAVGTGFTFLNSGPLFHVGTLMFHLATFYAGGTNVYMPDFDPAEAARLIEAERVDHMFGFGPMLDAIVAANTDENGHPRHDLSSLRFTRHSPAWDAQITVGTDPWNASGMGGYGQTEVGGMLTYLALGMGGAGSAGRPSPMAQVRILGPGGEELPVGATGEIVARGPGIFSGYFNRPALNARKMADGWYHTGDLGRREDDGTITFIGPCARMIKSGNENIYPAEVERALTSHPDVAEAAVIGVPDPAWGQSVTAVVRRAPGSALTADQVIAHVRAAIASYKKPRRVVFVDEELPRAGHGHDYAALDAAYGGGGYPGEAGTG